MSDREKSRKDLPEEERPGEEHPEKQPGDEHQEEGRQEEEHPEKEHPEKEHQEEEHQEEDHLDKEHAQEKQPEDDYPENAHAIDKQGELKQEEYFDDEQFVKAYSFSGTKVVLITLGIIFFLGLIIAASGGYYVYSQLQPVDPESDEEVEIEIPLGSSTAQIASILKENGLIHNERIFYYYVRLKNESGFQAGRYHLSPSMELDQIIQHLQEGILHEDTVRFTIPEGYTVEQIAEHLSQEGLVDKETFLRLVNEGDFSDVTFVSEIPDEVEGRDYRLEGFLYPETYDVYANTEEEEIIRKMLEQFEAVYREQWQEAAEEHELTMYEIVTLASIVEREAAVDAEREMIAGVIYNRLEKGMLLEVDATVQYALDEHVERLLNEHVQMDHPYNTYQYEDLPPGPIAVPSLKSIMAALNPAEHDYLYYVTKKDGSGEHYFAETYEEHQENDRLSRENEQKSEDGSEGENEEG